MTTRVVVGMQWGDEGKGKIVDILTSQADIVARYQGGANAGHTVVVGEEKFILHLIPSGILHPDKVCVIGNGVVIDLEYFFSEIDELKKRGINPQNRLWISESAHVVMPYHKIMEAYEEEERIEKIGTTLRGIGPAYQDKIARVGIRISDLWYKNIFEAKVKENLKAKQNVLKNCKRKLSSSQIVKNSLSFTKKIKNYVADTSLFLNRAIKQGKNLLLEGAQGTLLDVDFGTYPFGTSSNTTVGGACTGLGIAPKAIDEVIGVAKAYSTRVGNGPFPTELNNSLGNFLRQKGDEFGATTSRPRRCGWLDLVVLKYATRINGVEKLAITKLDVLDNLEEIKVCTGYKYKNDILKEFPPDQSLFERCKPIYETLPGWKANTQSLTKFEKLPANARRYLDYVQENTEAKIFLISTGCRRENTIVLD